MADFRNTITRSLELDDLVMEVAEALKYTRKLRGSHTRNAELENMISRELAIGCIKRIHQNMHSPTHPDYFPHKTYKECRKETIRRGQSLRYLEVQELVKVALRSHSAYPVGHHALDFQ